MVLSAVERLTTRPGERFKGDAEANPARKSRMYEERIMAGFGGQLVEQKKVK